MQDTSIFSGALRPTPFQFKVFLIINFECSLTPVVLLPFLRSGAYLSVYGISLWASSSVPLKMVATVSKIKEKLS